MPILRNLIFKAAQRIATDERIQKKAAETYHDEIKPVSYTHLTLPTILLV